MTQTVDTRSFVDCVYFVQGFCAKGALCPFRHDAAKLAAINTQRSQQDCKFWMQGFCGRGDACAFRHAKDKQPAAVSVVVPVESQRIVAAPAPQDKAEEPSTSQRDDPPTMSSSLATERKRHVQTAPRPSLNDAGLVHDKRPARPVSNVVELPARLAGRISLLTGREEQPVAAKPIHKHIDTANGRASLNKRTNSGAARDDQPKRRTSVFERIQVAAHKPADPKPVSGRSDTAQQVKRPASRDRQEPPTKRHGSARNKTSAEPPKHHRTDSKHGALAADSTLARPSHAVQLGANINPQVPAALLGGKLPAHDTFQLARHPKVDTTLRSGNNIVDHKLRARIGTAGAPSGLSVKEALAAQGPLAAPTFKPPKSREEIRKEREAKLQKVQAGSLAAAEQEHQMAVEEESSSHSQQPRASSVQPELSRKSRAASTKHTIVQATPEIVALAHNGQQPIPPVDNTQVLTPARDLLPELEEDEEFDLNEEELEVDFDDVEVDVEGEELADLEEFE